MKIFSLNFNKECKGLKLDHSQKLDKDFNEKDIVDEVDNKSTNSNDLKKEKLRKQVWCLFIFLLEMLVLVSISTPWRYGERLLKMLG